MEVISASEYFTDLFEHTGNLVHFLDLEGIIKLVNPAWLSALGYTLPEVIGRNVFDFIDAGTVDNYKEIRKKVITQHITGEVEIRFVSKNNTLITGAGEIGCFYKDGIPVYTRCIYKDVSSQRASEKLLEESEKRLKAFFSSAPDAVIVINERQKIIEWNPKAEVIFGYTAGEVLDKTLADTIIPHQYRDAHNKGIHHFLQTGAGPVLNKTIEITALHKSGHEFYINLCISHVRYKDEWLFIAFVGDITDRKKTEEALIRKEAELLQSKIMDEKKDAFISMAGHEFKTPITTIKTLAQISMLTWQENPGEINGYLDRLNQQADRLTSLINDLLNVSRMQLDKIDLRKTDVEMHVYLADIIHSIQLITPTHQIIFDRNELVTCAIDPLRMEQVIINMISNAVKYSPGREVIIFQSYAENSNLIISITDFGIGIPAENINNIFNRFYRVDQTSKSYTGLGIGLYISAEIVKQHSGTIHVESEESKGSTFKIILPGAVPCS